MCLCVLAVLELKAVKPGHTAIRGVRSSLYLCLNADGHLFALVSSDLFLLGNHFETFVSWVFD